MTKGKDFGTFPALEKILKRIHLSFHLKLPENEKKKKRNLQRQKNLLPPSLPEGGCFGREAGMGPVRCCPTLIKKYLSLICIRICLCVFDGYLCFCPFVSWAAMRNEDRGCSQLG